MKRPDWLPEQSEQNIRDMEGWFEGLKSPIFSVVLGTYGQVSVLPKVLKGWEDQRFTDGFEVFLCDDASPDGTKEWAKKYAKETPLQFKYLRVKKRVKPGCLAKNLNQALPHLRGHYTLFAMGDSVPQDDTLIQYAKHLGANRVLSGLRKNVNEKLEFQSIDWRFEDRIASQRAKIIPVTNEEPWAAITGNGLVVPTWALKKVGGWDEEYRGWESDDYDLALKLYELGLEFYLTPQAVLLHIEHPKQERAMRNLALFQRRLREYKERARKQIGTIVLDLDDFTPTNNGLFYLKKLREHFPRMKVSLFTIPLRASGNKIVEDWLQYPDLVKEINGLDWIEILPHGFFHPVPYIGKGEFEKISYDKTVLALKAIEEYFNQLKFNWAKVFKAPHWQISKGAMKALKTLGYVLAIRPDSELKIPEGLKIYKHNWGIQFPIPRGKVELRGHGHVQDFAGTGLRENFSNLLDLPVDAEWKFVSEMVAAKEGGKK